MIHRKGDVFTTDAKIIAHGANTEGVMGAGVAKTIREKYTRNYNVYRRDCWNKMATPGKWLATSQDVPGLLVLNLYTQDKPGANARYEWVFSSLMTFIRYYLATERRYGDVIALPEIGSGIGGLEWDKVEEILHVIEYIHPEIEFEVWHYEG